jgi:hypothetical protein
MSRESLLRQLLHKMQDAFNFKMNRTQITSQSEGLFNVLFPGEQYSAQQSDRLAQRLREVAQEVAQASATQPSATPQPERTRPTQATV